MLLLTLLLCLSNFGEAQVLDSLVITDDITIEERDFSSSTVDEFRDDSDFDYTQASMPGKSLWEMFKDWLRRVLNSLFSLEVGELSLLDIILYTICIIAAAYAIYKLIQIRARKLVVSDKDSGLPYNVHEENIHALDFDTLIREATDEHQYRRAIRLIYLYALKKLSDSHKIDWEPGKTNHDYLAELKDEGLKSGFGKLSYFFDYAWYGDFEVNENHLLQVRETFDHWKSEIR